MYISLEVTLMNSTLNKKEYLVYFFLATSIFWVLIARNNELFHWSTLALYACALVVGAEFVSWFRGDFSIFDPKGLVAFLGLHLFVIAPLLVVSGDYVQDHRLAPPDWKPWIGELAFFNAIGLFIVHKLSHISTPTKSTIRWTFATKRAVPILMVAFGLSLVSQVAVWRLSGGLTTIERVQGLGSSYIFQMFGSLTPFIGLLLVLNLNRSDEGRSRTSAFAIIVVLSLLSFFIDGLRGSRSSFLYSVFLLLGGVHFFWRPIPNRYFLYMLVPAFLFLYLYGFYKHYGSDVVLRYQQGYSVDDLSSNSKRNFKHVLIGDMSRTDVQAILLWRADKMEYEKRWGKTYANSALAVLLPKSIFDYGKCMEKSVAGGELLYGTKSRSICPTRIYGLLGESILNFGKWGIIPLFIVYGLLLRFIRKLFLSFHPKDLRLLLAPVITIAMISALANDVDNTLFLLVTKAAIPIAIIAAIRKRETIAPHYPAVTQLDN